MARVTLAGGRVACVLAVVAAVLAMPAAAAAAGTTKPAAASVRTGLAAHQVTPAARAAAPASRTAASSAAAVAPAAHTGSDAGAPTAPTAPTVPGAAPQGICDGLAILGLGGICQAGSAVSSSVNDLCSPGPPSPEPADSGIDAMIRPPAAAAGSGTGKLTLYQSYGMAGQSWAPYNLKCSDMTSMIGNSVANAVFDAAKAVDRITITTYQSAAGEGLLSWLKQRVDQLISAIGNAVYFPYLAPIVLLGVVWLAWQGLIRKRASRTVEGTIWMVVACVAAIWLIGRPSDFTGLGQKTSDGVNQVLNAAFSRLPVAGGTSCVPVQKGDPQSTGGSNFAYTAGSQVVSENADELWAVLVCKPWVAGEFGTMSAASGGPGNTAGRYSRALLWAQAYAVNERPTTQLATQKQDVYQGIANKLQQDPAIYPLFQGKQWATRLEIAFAALFAALIAGALVLLIAITLIVLKLGFLLLLVAGPFFLIIGTHPGFGRVIAIRWFEMLVGVLMKMVAVALTLSVLLYCYALVMSVSDNALPWVFKIMMIALLTVAVFIYRKPFQHLFTSVGYDMAGARERAEAYREQARFGFRGQTVRTATSVVPGYGSYRANRWARRNPDQADQAVFLASHIAAAVATDGNGAASGKTVTSRRGGNGSADGHGPADLGTEPNGGGPGRSPRGSKGGPGLRPDISGGNGGGRREPPPLDLPRRPRTAPPRWQPGPVRSTPAPGTRAPASPGPTAPAPASPAPAHRPAPASRARAPASPAQAPRQAPPPRPTAAGGGATYAAPQRRQTPRPGAPARPARPARPAERPPSEGTPSPPQSQREHEGPPMPFWLRPIRRDR